MAELTNNPPIIWVFFTSDALKLILTRHAKSAWDDPLIEDHDRVLNTRGQRSAGLIGDWLAARGHAADHALCSSAARAQETMERILPCLRTAPKVTLEPRLYLASPDTLVRHIRRQSAGVLWMIGHNPGMGDLAIALTKTMSRHPDFSRYPTAATTVFEFDIETWRDLRLGTGRIADFIVPRELEAVSVTG